MRLFTCLVLIACGVWCNVEARMRPGVSPHGGKPTVNLMVTGHAKSGKSTLVGHMLVKRGEFRKGILREYEVAASLVLNPMEANKYVWLTKQSPVRYFYRDTLFYNRFYSDRYVVQAHEMPVTDPQRQDRAFVTGELPFDAALFVVSALPAEFESALAATREQATVTSLMGVGHVVCCVNKMDAVGYSRARFEHVKQKVISILKRAGFNPRDVTVIPVSALEGVNLDEASRKMRWYRGNTLTGAIDALRTPVLPTNKPLRIPLAKVDFNLNNGYVISGVIRNGMDISVHPFKPANYSGKITSLVTRDGGTGVPRDYVAFIADGLISAKRGMVVADLNGDPPRLVESFTAKIVLLAASEEITKESEVPVYVHNANFTGKVLDMSKIDRRTGKVLDADVGRLKRGETGLVTMVPEGAQVCLERYRDYPQLGRIAITNRSGKLAMIGHVTSIDGPTSSSKKEKKTNKKN